MLVACRLVQFRAKVALAELQVGHKQKGAYLIGQLLQRYPGYPEMLLAAAAVSPASALLCCPLSLHVSQSKLPPTQRTNA